MTRSCKLLRAVDVLTITTPHGKPRKNGLQPMHTSVYVVTPLDSDKRVAYPAWRLTKLCHTGEVYDVHTDAHGEHCSCGDGNYRRENMPEKCKHVLALKACGLI